MRLESGLLLGSRTVLAAYARRHESVIRRHVTPIACDVRTRAALFDLEAAVDTLRHARRVA